MCNKIQGKRSAGFTLIELMIVIAIVAILVAIAVPAYKDYTIRTKVTECVNHAAVAKVQITEYRQTLGSWPPTAAEAGVETASGVATSEFCLGFINYDPEYGSFEINVNEGAVDVILSTVQPIMMPTQDGTSTNMNWDCNVGNTSPNDVRYLPSSCRDT